MKIGFYANLFLGLIYFVILFLISWKQSGGDIFFIMALSILLIIHLIFIFILTHKNESLIKGALFGWFVVLIISITVFSMVSQYRRDVVPHTIIGFPD